MTHSSYANSIELPTDEDFKNLRHAKQFAIDIGMYFTFYWRIEGGGACSSCPPP